MCVCVCAGQFLTVSCRYIWCFRYIYFFIHTHTYIYILHLGLKDTVERWAARWARRTRRRWSAVKWSTGICGTTGRRQPGRSSCCCSVRERWMDGGTGCRSVCWRGDFTTTTSTRSVLQTRSQLLHILKNVRLKWKLSLAAVTWRANFEEFQSLYLTKTQRCGGAAGLLLYIYIFNQATFCLLIPFKLRRAQSLQ